MASKIFNITNISFIFVMNALSQRFIVLLNLPPILNYSKRVLSILDGIALLNRNSNLGILKSPLVVSNEVIEGLNNK